MFDLIRVGAEQEVRDLVSKIFSLLKHKDIDFTIMVRSEQESTVSLMSSPSLSQEE